MLRSTRVAGGRKSLLCVEEQAWGSQIPENGAGNAGFGGEVVKLYGRLLTSPLSQHLGMVPSSPYCSYTTGNSEWGPT